MHEHAKVAEAMVRKAAWEESKLPGPPPMSVQREAYPGGPMKSWGLDAEIYSSESPHARNILSRDFERSPYKVLVIFECCLGPLRSNDITGDTKQGWRFMDRVVKRLKSDPWIVDAGWESWNSAIAYVWIKPWMRAGSRGTAVTTRTAA